MPLNIVMSTQNQLNMLTSLPWSTLVWPITFIVLTTGVTLFIRWFGDHETKAEAVGADLNLIAFGFSIDLLVRMMKNEDILPNWTYTVPKLVPVVALIFLNIVLFMINLKLSKNIDKRVKAGSTTQARVLRVISIFWGIISSVSFVCAGGYWG
jgi:hypothetical protein